MRDTGALTLLRCSDDNVASAQEEAVRHKHQVRVLEHKTVEVQVATNNTVLRVVCKNNEQGGAGGVGAITPGAAIRMPIPASLESRFLGAGENKHLHPASQH